MLSAFKIAWSLNQVLLTLMPDLTSHFRADRTCDKAREALEQQARVKGKKGFRPEYNPLMGSGGGGGGFR